MEPKQLSEIKEKIINQINLLSKRNNNCEIDLDGDDVDISQGSLLLHLMNEQTDRNKAKIIALCGALDKIKRNEYGICEDCNEEIGFKRLLACPETLLCIKCAEIQEKLSKEYKR